MRYMELNDKFTFGKYKHKYTLQDAISKDFSYVYWAVTNNAIILSDKAYQLIESKLMMTTVAQLKTIPEQSRQLKITSKKLLEQDGYIFFMQTDNNQYMIVPVDKQRITKPVTNILSYSTESEAMNSPATAMFGMYVIYEPLRMIKEAIFSPLSDLADSFDYYVHYIKQSYLYNNLDEPIFDKLATEAEGRMKAIVSRYYSTDYEGEKNTCKLMFNKLLLKNMEIL